MKKELPWAVIKEGSSAVVLASGTEPPPTLASVPSSWMNNDNDTQMVFYKKIRRKGVYEDQECLTDLLQALVGC